MFAIGFNWRDLWVGFYVSKDKRTVFFCPLPTIVLGFGYNPKRRVHGTTEKEESES